MFSAFPTGTMGRQQSVNLRPFSNLYRLAVFGQQETFAIPALTSGANHEPTLSVFSDNEHLIKTDVY
jgi:hypothetical protein